MSDYCRHGIAMERACPDCYDEDRKKRVSVNRLDSWRPAKEIDQPGLYLRSNPPASAIVKLYVVKIDGALRWIHGESPKTIPMSKLPQRFWVYGPIPDAPREPASDQDHTRNEGSEE